ncbi:unnamed protein product [Menidia menidia]|uniref:(Atlantic silverside) hypothetical protein n=1 Tax=Menidia menidia TaxID=238744 RepID=A0A8S4BUB1_9TELE|nr:unnamed protein product [Menidia menidia]
MSNCNSYSTSPQSATPSPQQYQPDQSKLKVLPPGKFPFSSTTQRFQCAPCTARDTPGPGSYAQEAVRNRKVSWPMRFGSPDWSRLPQLQKKSLRVKVSDIHQLILTDEREFQKRRNRLAYLSLYY